MFEHRMSRIAAQGATVLSSGLLLLGMAGTAGADTPSAESPTGNDKQQLQDKGSHDGDQNSLVGVDHNQIPVQVCHNQVPVNVLGVQVPVKDVDAAVGLGLLGGEGGKAPVLDDSSCSQPAAQQN